MSVDHISIRTNRIQEDRVRGVPLHHPSLAGLAAAGVRALGLDWRQPGHTWGEGLSPTILLFWISSGTVAVEGVTAGSNQCLVVPPTTPKRLRAVGGPLHAAYIHLAPGPRWLHLPERPTALSRLRAGGVATLIAVLADEALTDDGPLLRPLGEAVLACCAALATDVGGRHRLQTVWDEVAAYPARPWSVPTLARRAGVSPGHFHRLVQELHRTAPMAVVRRLRLERAADLLRTTLLPLSAIAADVGYGNGFALSNAMYRELGVRPRQLRTI